MESMQILLVVATQRG
jgi:hypothetical protein